MTGDDLAANGHGAMTAAHNGSHAIKESAPSVMSNQLREELIRILQEGDSKSAGAFTATVATRVEKFAVAAREILMTEKLAQNDITALMTMRRHPMGGWNSLVGGSVSVYNDSDAVLPPIINNENFGVQAVRQAIDAARTMNESPAKLVEALAVARASNLADVVAVLEKKLGISKKDPDPDTDDDASEGTVA